MSLLPLNFLFPKTPALPPPPPNPASLASPSIAEQSAAERQRLASASGEGFSGTDVTGGQGVKDVSTTANPKPSKSVLGG